MRNRSNFKAPRGTWYRTAGNRELSGRVKQVAKAQNLDHHVANTPSLWPIFIKSVEEKRLTGKVIRRLNRIVKGRITPFSALNL